jgi:hypothetical protein
MSTMRNVHLRNLHLNLLQPLHALLEEQHVTRAARRSCLSQPAMSRALERLREMFGDPLLVRSGRGYERAVRGERVLRAFFYGAFTSLQYTSMNTLVYADITEEETSRRKFHREHHAADVHSFWRRVSGGWPQHFSFPVALIPTHHK